METSSNKAVENYQDSPILTHGTQTIYEPPVVLEGVARSHSEMVMQLTHVETSHEHVLEFQVLRYHSEDDESGTVENFYSASTPYRAIEHTGRTAEEAIGSLLFSYACLSRDGAFNPHLPSEQGDPPIQHVISILTERLNWHIQRRHQHLTEAQIRPAGAPNDPYVGNREQAMTATKEDNKIIAALGTAIAALGRVEEL
jgi:hypothetical protein